jgi:hypothetical protein
MLCSAGILACSNKVGWDNKQSRIPPMATGQEFL